MEDPDLDQVFFRGIYNRKCCGGARGGGLLEKNGFMMITINICLEDFSACALAAMASKTSRENANT